MSYFDLRDNVLDYDSQDCLGCLAVYSQDTQIYDLYLSDASFVISLQSSSLTFKSKFGKSTPALFIFFTSLSIFSLLSTPHRKLHICWLEMYSRGRTLTLWFQCHKTKLHVCFAGFFSICLYLFPEGKSVYSIPHPHSKSSTSNDFQHTVGVQSLFSHQLATEYFK